MNCSKVGSINRRMPTRNPRAAGTSSRRAEKLHWRPECRSFEVPAGQKISDIVTPAARRQRRVSA
jgi:hypothetical protein